MKALIVLSVTIRGAFFHNRLRPFRVRRVEIITSGYRIDARLNNQTENKKTVMWKWIMQKRLRGNVATTAAGGDALLIRIMLQLYPSHVNHVCHKVSLLSILLYCKVIDLGFLSISNYNVRSNLHNPLPLNKHAN